MYVCGAVGQAQYVCVCGTKSSADEQSSITIQSTSHNCWLRRVLDVAQQDETKDDGYIAQNCKTANNTQRHKLIGTKGDRTTDFLCFFCMAFCGLLVRNTMNTNKSKGKKHDYTSR